MNQLAKLDSATGAPKKTAAQTAMTPTIDPERMAPGLILNMYTPTTMAMGIVMAMVNTPQGLL